jgi:predicted dehydrogenase
MPDSLRYILVGAGGYGAHWCRFTLPRLKESGKAVCVAAVDANPDALKNAQQYLGVAPEHCYTDFADALDVRQCNFVLIVAPPAHHEKLIDLSLIYDKHILLEAPIAESMEATCRIYKKVKDSGRKMAIAVAHRFDQDKQTLERMVRANDFGRLNYVVGRFSVNFRRAGTWGSYRHQMHDPIFVEAATHHFEILRALSNSEPRSVFAQSWNAPWGQFKSDTTALVNIQMINHVHCLYEGSLVNASSPNGFGQEYVRAECESGTLELDRRQLRVLTGGPHDEPKALEVPLLEHSLWGNALVAEQFCDWLLGAQPPLNALASHIQTAALVFAAAESGHTGKAIEVQEYLKKSYAAAKESLTSSAADLR